MNIVKREWLPCGGARLSIGDQTVLFVAKEDIGVYFSVINRLLEANKCNALN